MGNAMSAHREWTRKARQSEEYALGKKEALIAVKAKSEELIATYCKDKKKNMSSFFRYHVKCILEGLE